MAGTWRHRTTLWSLLGLIASTASAQSRQRSSAADTIRSGAIVGQVLDATTHRAVVFASVTIAGTTLRATTDPNGKFSLRPIPPGTYTVEVRHIGYTPLIRPDVLVGPGETATLALVAARAPFRLAEVIV